jgi:glycosyltransferase involved in cell wall biosynthesis
MINVTQPLVSVGIITYNHENYIRQCLDGIMMQKTNFAIEVVIGEDNSTDGTRAIIKEFEKKYPGIIKPIYHDKNVGGARNAYEFVYPRLTGTYIAICEGDDYWTDPYKLQKQVDFLEQNKEYVMCYHLINIVNQHDVMVTEQAPVKGIQLHKPLDIFHLKIPTLTVVFRNCIKSFPAEMFNVRSCDTFLFGMLSCYGGAADLGFVGANYRKHEGGVYTRMKTIEQYKQAINTLRIMKSTTLYDKTQRSEISREVIIRKKRYIRQFIRKIELLNCFKIAFT